MTFRSRRRDIDDLDDTLFDREEAERRRRERAEQVENHRRVEAEQAALDAKRAAKFREWSKQKALESIRRDYARLGVVPPCVDGAGEPTCSVGLLLHLGWRIEDTPDGRAWIKPLTPEPWTGPRDNDSLPETSKQGDGNGKGNRGFGRGRGGKPAAGAKEEGESR